MWNSVAIISHVKPKYVIWENVKNVLSKRHIHNFTKYLTSLDEIGYNNYYQVLNAKDFGIPQNRERIYCISIRKDIDSGSFQFPDKKELHLTLKDLLESNVDDKFYLSEEKIRKIENSNFLQERRRIQDKDYCDTLLARDWKDPKCIRIGGIYDTDEARHQAGSIYDEDGISPALDTMQGGNRQPMILDTVLKKENNRIRKLTPRECWRLMGFSDEDFNKAKEIDISNSQLYKQAGNSIVVNVLEEIFKKLFL